MYHKYISRVEADGGYWYVRVPTRKEKHAYIQKAFYDSHHNTNEDESLEEAIKFRNQSCEKECVPNNVNRKFSVHPTSSKKIKLPVGIFDIIKVHHKILSNGENKTYKYRAIMCTWSYTPNKFRSKCFSVKKYGRKKAIKLAISFRNDKLKEIYIESQTCVVKED